MKREQKQAQEGLKISCSYQQEGPDAQQLIQQSFRLFVTSELMKLCG